MAKIDIETLKELIKKYPNDADLGREIRNFLNKITIEKNENLNGDESKRDGKPS